MCSLCKKLQSTASIELFMMDIKLSIASYLIYWIYILID